MKTKFISPILICLFLMAYSNDYKAQYKNTFTLRFLKAKFTDTTYNKDVVVIIHVSVRDTINYPPVINMPPKASIIVNGVKKSVDVSPGHLSLTIYDDRLMIKNVAIYDLVKDKVNFKDPNKMIIMVFQLKDISFENFTKMSFGLSLTEKHDPNNKLMKEFEFEVDK